MNTVCFSNLVYAIGTWYVDIHFIDEIIIISWVFGYDNLCIIKAHVSYDTHIKKSFLNPLPGVFNEQCPVLQVGAQLTWPK